MVDSKLCTIEEGGPMRETVVVGNKRDEAIENRFMR